MPSKLEEARTRLRGEQYLAAIGEIGGKDAMDAINEAVDDLIRAAKDEEAQACVDRLEKYNVPAHTYGSENADHYRGFDAGVLRCIQAIRARIAARAKEEGEK